MILLASQIVVVITSVVVFLLVIILLVAILLYVKKKLTPSGTVNVDINDGYLEIETNPGDTLLTTLGNNKVLLPSACGGGGRVLVVCAVARLKKAEVLSSPLKQDSLPVKNRTKTGGLPVR